MPKRLPARAVFVAMMVVGLAACTANASGSEDAVSPESIRTDWTVSHSTDGPPIALDVGPLSVAGDGWATHTVVLRGAQIEYVVDLGLPAERFEAAERELIPIRPARPPDPVRLGFDGRVSVEVVIRNELPAGRHTFDLVVPTWINQTEPSGEPDDEIVITLGYTVQPRTEQVAVEAFCAEAVPLTDARRPSLDDLDRLSSLAGDELDDDGRRRLTTAIGRLRQDLAAFESNSGDRFDTGEVNDIIGRICNVEMESESVES